MKNRNDEISIKDILSILRPKLLLIVLISLACAAAAFVYTAFIQKEQYTSTSLVYIYADTQQNATSGDLDVAITMVDVYKVMLTTDAFLTPVLKALPQKYESLELKPSQIKQMIGVQQVDSTQMIEVSVTSTDKELAYEIACKIVELAPGQLDTIVPNSLSIVSIDHPVEAEAPNPKNENRNTVLAFVISAVISSCVVFLTSFLGLKIKDAKDFEAKVGSPFLGIIPTDKNEGIFDISKILYLPIIGKCKKIAITGAYSGEEKSSFSSGISIAVAKNSPNKKILLIDLDMRSPRIAKLMKEFCNTADNPSGISEFLAGIDESPSIRKCSLNNLDVVFSGKGSATPVGLISSPRFDEFVSAAEANYDYIIFDCPPINDGSDAFLISNKVDGYILAARYNSSGIKALSDAVLALKDDGANVFGAVISSSNSKKHLWDTTTKLG